MSMSRSIPLALAAFIVVGCDSAEQTTAPDLALTTPSFAVTKVAVCHRQAAGDYVRIDIAEAAYETHIAHGDEPAGSGGLDENCQPQACPCFSAESVAEGIATWEGMFFYDRTPYTGIGFHTALFEAKRFSTGDDQVFFAYYDGSDYSCGTELLWVQNITQTACEACRAILLEYEPEY
jgi:hypothetical protein